jgi:ribonuclease J
MLIVTIDQQRRPQVHGFGLPLDEDYAEFVVEAERDVIEALKRLKGPKARDREEVMEVARLAARRAAQRWSGKKPQTRVILAEDRA